jgi:hypothetical protein
MTKRGGRGVSQTDFGDNYGAVAILSALGPAPIIISIQSNS